MKRAYDTSFAVQSLSIGDASSRLSDEVHDRVLYLAALLRCRDQWLAFCEDARNARYGPVVFPWDQGPVQITLYDQRALDLPLYIVAEITALRWDTRGLSSVEVKACRRELYTLSTQVFAPPRSKDWLTWNLARPQFGRYDAVGQKYNDVVWIHPPGWATYFEDERPTGHLVVARVAIERALNVSPAQLLPAELWSAIWRLVLVLRCRDRWLDFATLAYNCHVVLPPLPPHTSLNRRITLPLSCRPFLSNECFIVHQIHAVEYHHRTGGSVTGVDATGYAMHSHDPYGGQWRCVQLRRADGCYSGGIEHIACYNRARANIPDYMPYDCYYAGNMWHRSVPQMGHLSLPVELIAHLARTFDGSLFDQ